MTSDDAPRHGSTGDDHPDVLGRGEGGAAAPVHRAYGAGGRAVGAAYLNEPVHALDGDYD
jgi:hypothetical protein